MLHFALFMLVQNTFYHLICSFAFLWELNIALEYLPVLVVCFTLYKRPDNKAHEVPYISGKAILSRHKVFAINCKLL